MFLTLSSGSSTLPQALLLGLLGLWPVLVHKLEQLGGGLPVQAAVELVDCWGAPSAWSGGRPSASGDGCT